MLNINNTEIKQLTNEELQNPSLIDNREDLKDKPISFYYGSEKEGIENTCLDCQKRKTCRHLKYALKQEKMLKNNLENPFYRPLLSDMSDDEIEKLKHNVFIIIKCKFKRKEN